MNVTKSGGSSGTRPNKTLPPVASPTVLDWTQALEAALRSVPARRRGATVAEIADVTGVPARTVRDGLRKLIAEGQVHVVPRGGEVVSISGVVKCVASYVLTTKTKKKGKRKQ